MVVRVGLRIPCCLGMYMYYEAPQPFSGWALNAGHTLVVLGGVLVLQNHGV